MSKHALITGITGQDGSYLAELLLEQGYEVYGIMRRKSVVDYGNVEHIKEKIHFIYADMTDVISLISAMRISQADEVYNLAAQSFVLFLFSCLRVGPSRWQPQRSTLWVLPICWRQSVP